MRRCTKSNKTPHKLFIPTIFHRNSYFNPLLPLLHTNQHDLSGILKLRIREVMISTTGLVDDNAI